MEAEDKGYKVLVVDDEVIVREMIVQILTMNGHRPEAVANGRQALELMDLHYFDAVITDICMPEMDGITLTKEILSRYGDLPVMVITGYPDQYSSESAIKAGAMEFIIKPFSNPELAVRFQKMMADFSTIAQLKQKKSELAQKSSKILGQMKSEADQEIKRLQDEIEALKHRQNSAATDQERAS